jgi:hypothetical protein
MLSAKVRTFVDFLVERFGPEATGKDGAGLYKPDGEPRRRGKGNEKPFAALVLGLFGAGSRKPCLVIDGCPLLMLWTATQPARKCQ